MIGLAPTKQTTDLRKGLSDRAIYWIDVPQVGGWRTLWKPDDSRDIYCYFDENRLGDTELVVSHLTPAQVLAATTVVRCRDCKYCRKSFDGRGVVCVLRSLHHFYTDPDGYCSNGKLRDLPSTGSAGGQARGLYQSEEIVYGATPEQAISATVGGSDVSALRAKVKAQSDYIGKLRGEYKALDEQMERRCAEYRATIRKLKAELDAATVGAGTIEKAAERIEVLSGFAREYLHRYGMLMSMAGEDVTDEVLAMESVINEVCGRKVVDE